MQNSAEATSPFSAESCTFSISKALILHGLCVLTLAFTLWIAQSICFLNLISNPVQTLCLLWLFLSLIVILGYSLLRRCPNHCSYWTAVARGVLALPAGAILNAFGAFVLGAPVRIEFLMKTINWSLLMSLFNFVPAASVYGASWRDWQRLFAHSKPTGDVDFMICLPAHGAVIGAWFGAWPMPLDWERPWQEWPICVSYGAITGYVIGMLASLVFIHVFGRQHHGKAD